MIALLFLVLVGLIIVVITRRGTRSDAIAAANRRIDTLEKALERMHERITVVEHRATTPSGFPPAASPVPLPAPAPPSVSMPAAVPAPRTASPTIEPAADSAVTSPARPPVLPRREPGVAPSGQEAHKTPIDWESVVGTNWLNKAGVLAFVIGLALFLGYSLNHMGPMGRVAVGWAVSLAMIAGGVWLERQADYTLFGHGFIAGGWAAAYFTAYAMFALPAAQVIDSPIVGSSLLLAVAGAMVAHSLRYRSEALTTLTYAIAFATLNVAPMRTFTLVASWPLCASLLVLTWRYGWTTLGAAGVVTAYGSIFVRMFNSSGGTLDELWALQGLLAMHWMLFEGFDILQCHRGWTTPGTRAMFPVNAIAFLLLSMVTWTGYPEAPFYLESIAGAAFVVSAALRAWLKPETREDEAQNPLAVFGGFELPVTVAATLFAAALQERFFGIQLALMLALEAELILLLGFRVRGSYLRGLACVGHALALATTVGAVFGATHLVHFAGYDWHGWLPAVLLLIALHYGNARLLHGQAHHLITTGSLFAGSLLLNLVVGQEAPVRFAGLIWLAVAAPFLEVARRTRFIELRWHAYVFVLMGAVSLDLAIAERVPFARQWMVLWLATLLSSLLAVRVGQQDTRVPVVEQTYARAAVAALATLLLAAAIRRSVPNLWIGVSWLGAAWLLAEAGRARQSRLISRLGYGLLAAAIGRLLSVNLGNEQEVLHVTIRVLTFVPAAATLYYLSVGPIDRRLAIGFNTTASLLIALLLAVEMPTRLVTPAWAVQGLALVAVGFAARSLVMRRSGLVLLALSMAKLLAYDAQNFDTPARILSFMLLGAALIAGSWLYTRFNRRLTDAR